MRMFRWRRGVTRAHCGATRRHRRQECERFLVKRNMFVLGFAAVCVVLIASCVATALLMRVPARSQPNTQQAAHKPGADFTATITSGVAPLVVRFTDTSIDSPTSWRWNFGDGATATTQNPTHSYKVMGAYTVSLVASNARGSSTTTKSDYITVKSAQPPSGWTTIIDDEFNAPGLPSHWIPYTGSYGDSAHNCAATSQDQVPGDGYLHLKMQYHTSGACGAGWYTGGMQIASEYGGVDQAITVRWRIVPSAAPNVVRSHRIIPMRWVDDPKYSWEQGESNYCEGSFLGGCYSYLHYGPNSTQISHGYLVDLTKWHTWRIEQHNYQVSVFIDNMTKPVWVYKGDATTIPSSSKRAVLQQECPLSGCPSGTFAGDVEDIQIDWITIQNWQGAKAASQGASGGGSQAATVADDLAPATYAYAGENPVKPLSTTMLVATILPITELRRRHFFL